MSDLPDLPDIDDLLDLIDDVVSDWDDVAELDTDVEDPGTDEDLADLEPEAEGDDEVADEVEVEVDDDAAPDSFVADPPEEPAGACRADVLGDAFELVGLAEAGEVLSAFGDESVESREMVAAMDDAGLMARVEHSSVGELAEWLESGVEVLLGGGGGGSAHAIVAVERDGTVMVEPLAGGARTALSLDHFEAMWDAIANEVLVVEATAGAVALGPSEVVVVPLGIDELAIVGGI